MLRGRNEGGDEVSTFEILDAASAPKPIAPKGTWDKVRKDRYIEGFRDGVLAAQGYVYYDPFEEGEKRREEAK